jgi:putative Holliday junction resolvase
MKYLGIDYGTKRVGLALSDETGTIARPFLVLKNTPNLISDIEKIIQSEKVEGIVVGGSGGNKIETDINEFIGQLSLVTLIPIEKITEAFTSYEAHDREGKESRNDRQTKKPEKPDNLDARAAAIILERFLNKKK